MSPNNRAGTPNGNEPSHGHSPSTSTETLRKVLRLELSQDCKDQVVIGGLAKMAVRLRDEILAHTPAESNQSLTSQLTALGRYREMSRPARGKLLRGVLAALGEDGIGAEPAAQEKPGADAQPKPKRRQPKLTARYLLEDPVGSLPGAGRAMVARLKKLGITTIMDLLSFYPRRHLDYTDTRTIGNLRGEGFETVSGEVVETSSARTRSGLVVIRSVITDGTGSAVAVWFRRQDYISQTLKAGRKVVLTGRSVRRRRGWEFQDPEWENADGDQIHTVGLVPVYPSTEGLSVRTLRRLVRWAVDNIVHLIPEMLPDRVLKRYKLISLSEAVADYHFPGDLERKGLAQRRLAFDEMLVIQLGALRKRHEWRHERAGPVIPLVRTKMTEWIWSLPFRLTDAQRRALAEILDNLAKPLAMSRLLQGDVGSGKTVVATLSALAAIENGYQVALMAPTEVLAEQHFRSISGLIDAMAQRSVFERKPVVRLLTGSVLSAAREQVYNEAEHGNLDLIIGTQALIQGGLTLGRLGLAIIDEQHRFGVLQRAELRQKGYNPHILLMTATPIPRTLTLTVYGDLDISTLKEMPPGRQPVKTTYLESGERETAYRKVRDEVTAGRQTFIVCPLIEESESLAAKAATAEFDKVRTMIFPDLRVGLLHGRMSSREKERIMREFVAGEIHILVTTAVVEVGIDVPNATVMIIEGAERFGMAQLHQFRGRVGRGEHPGECFLLCDDPGPDQRRRLQIVATTTDGFLLAEEDLKMRGPGEFLGTRQSGLPDLKVAELTDYPLIMQTREAAEAILAEDPTLSTKDFSALAGYVRQRFAAAEPN